MSDIAAAVRRLARWIEDNAEQLTDRVLDRLRDEISGSLVDTDPALADLGRQSALANLRAIAGGLTAGRMLPSQPPPGAIELALSAANEGIAWTTLVRRQEFGHAELWERMIEEIDGWELTDQQRTLLLQVASRYLFRYRDFVSTELTEVYQAQREQVVRSREHRRIGLVRELLAGLPAADDELDYRLQAHHVGAIAWGGLAEQRLLDVAQQHRLRAAARPGAGRSTWAWFGASHLGTGTKLLATLEGARPPEDTFVALGDPAFGLEGFGRTHREALQAFRVAALRPRSVTRYDDVALEALALTDERVAREFVARELGPLIAVDSRTATLRKTLRAYFQAGQNRAAAAALLAVHERTVGYRLKSVEQLLGHAIGDRREELGVALRVQSLLELAGAGVIRTA